MNDHQQDRLETQLRQLAPARPPAEFLARLRAAGPPAQLRHAASQGSHELPLEGSPDRGGDSLSPQFQARQAGTKLSPPCNAAPETPLAAPLVPRPRLAFWLPILRWLAPAAGLAAVALLVWHRGGSPASPPLAQPAIAASPAAAAENVRVDQELVGAFEAVARLPDGESVRFRCQKWMDQVVLRDPDRGLVIQQRSPRLEVVPVRFETY